MSKAINASGTASNSSALDSTKAEIDSGAFAFTEVSNGGIPESLRIVR
jgi:hypothetical protein